MSDASVSSLTTALVLARQSCRIAPEYNGKSALPKRLQDWWPLLPFIRDLLLDWKKRMDIVMRMVA